MAGKVLVADDSLNVQKTLSQLLGEAGIEVVTVGNGEHAVRKLAQFKPDVVLADVFMPVRSGFEVCEYIKSSEEFSHVPVLLLASTLEPYDEKEALRVGADGRVSKPFSEPAAVLNSVQEWLAKAAEAKPVPAPPAVEEAAPVEPAVEEPGPEPTYEEFTTRPPAVSFEGREAPMGFAEVLEEAGAAEIVPAEPVEEAPPEQGPPAAMVPEPEAPPVEPLPAPPWPLEPAPETPPAPAEAAPAKPSYQIEKPEVAPAWEMPKPPAGAPEVPAGGEWDSQWKGVEEAAPPAPAEAAPPPVEPPREEPAAVDAALVEAVVQEVLQRLSPQVIEQLSKDIIRPLAEALLKQKLDQQ